MQLLDACHARGFLYKMTGGCNAAKRDVNRCLRAERVERTARNREEARRRRERVEAGWREIEENS